MTIQRRLCLHFLQILQSRFKRQMSTSKVKNEASWKKALANRSIHSFTSPAGLFGIVRRPTLLLALASPSMKRCWKRVKPTTFFLLAVKPLQRLRRSQKVTPLPE